MPGWQIALIAIGAALLTATVAVIVGRARAAHRKTITGRLNHPGRQPVPHRPQPGPGGVAAGRPGR
jgi:hypothetical protein